MTIDRLENVFIDSSISFSEKKNLIHLHQLDKIAVYKDYADRLTSVVDTYGPVPIPIDIFKYNGWGDHFEPELTFRSSGTGGARSTHRVLKSSVYERSIEASFTEVFGRGPFTIASHLPGYEERGKESSLLYMVEHLVNVFGNEDSGSFFGDENQLNRQIETSLKTAQPLIVFGAAFGLIDLVETSTCSLPENSRVIETGGMKTHRKEIDRTTLHHKLSEGFEIDRKNIYSEYGMCELLSQCYTRGGESLVAPEWMEVKIVDPEAPWKVLPDGVVGTIAIFDCANMHSLSSILTGDRGRMTPSGFEVLGRLENSELRGCNFLIEDYIK